MLFRVVFRPGSHVVLAGWLLSSCMPVGGGPNARAKPAPTASSAQPVDPFAGPEANARTIVDVPAAASPPPVLIRRGTVITAAGKRFSPGYVLLQQGHITAVGDGDGPEPPAGTTIVDAVGEFVTPGIIDPHSHMGVYPVPETAAHDDGNELTDPVTAGLRAEHSFWPQDPAIERAVAGGVTTIAALPGSGNLIGGRGVVMHLLPQRGARAMRFPGAPEILKMACGENPKRVYREQKRAPTTRMGNLRAVREAFVKAQKYARDWNDWEKKAQRPPKACKPDDKECQEGAKPPDRDLALETLALVMRGDILVEWHCYQADDMLAALQVADEFGFRVRAFHHALEAYKIRDVLAYKRVAVATWDDWWGFKMEAYDGIPENLALLTEAGVRAAVHSDSPIANQFLNQAAGKALSAGRAAGIRVDEEDAIRWLTANPAWVLGIDDQVGTLEPGKRADVVVWSEQPMSTYARAMLVYVDGQLAFDRGHVGAPWSDFELGVRGMPAAPATATVDGGVVPARIDGGAP
jgi:imidazolonepropionase-like amidohydrolase